MRILLKITIFATDKTLKCSSMKNNNADEETRGRNGKRRKPWYGETGETIAIIAVVVVLVSVFALDRCGDSVHQQQPSSIIMRDIGQLRHNAAADKPAVSTRQLPRTEETPQETARREGMEAGYNDGMEDGEVGEKYETHYSENASDYSGKFQECYEDGYEEGYDEGYSEGRQMHDDAL